MSKAENLHTFEEFVDNGWRNSHTVRTVEEIVSTYKETHRLVDTWPYFLDENRIVIKIKDEGKGSVNKVYVEDLIAKRGDPEEKEAEVFKKLENWAKGTEEGTAFWISPSYPGKYPCSKIIIHTIAYEFGTLQKTILNSTILFESNENKILECLHSLFPSTTTINDLESFRSVLLTQDKVDIQKVFSEVANLDKNLLKARPNLSDEEISSRARYIASLIEKGESARIVAYEAERLGLIGQFSISCPSMRAGKGFSEVVSMGMEDQYGSLQFKCPKCGATNTRPFGELLENCQSCGGNVRC